MRLKYENSITLKHTGDHLNDQNGWVGELMRQTSPLTLLRAHPKPAQGSWTGLPCLQLWCPGLQPLTRRPLGAYSIASENWRLQKMGTMCLIHNCLMKYFEHIVTFKKCHLFIVRLTVTSWEADMMFWLSLYFQWNWPKTRDNMYAMCSLRVLWWLQ